MRILIIKPSSLGDVVHALPTVNLIRKRFPDAHVSWLINAELASLLKNCPVIDERIEFHRRDPGKFPALLWRLHREHFDIVVDLQGLLRSGLMTWATRAARRIGLSDAREGARSFYTERVDVPRAHAVERYLFVARHLGCNDAAVEFPLGVAAKHANAIHQLARAGSSPGPSGRGLIAIHPSARWPTKLWGDGRFAELIRRLPRGRVVLTGSASEHARIEQMARDCRNLAGGTVLFELAELYARCCVVITNDSGPMHIAAAVGTPVVAIFGPTDPALTGPYGKNHVVLRAGIPCSPCMKDHCTHTPPMECMALVTVEQVLEAARAFL